MAPVRRAAVSHHGVGRGHELRDALRRLRRRGVHRDVHGRSVAGDRRRRDHGDHVPDRDAAADESHDPVRATQVLVDAARRSSLSWVLLWSGREFFGPEVQRHLDLGSLALAPLFLPRPDRQRRPAHQPAEGGVRARDGVDVRPSWTWWAQSLFEGLALALAWKVVAVGAPRRHLLASGRPGSADATPPPTPPKMWWCTPYQWRTRAGRRTRRASFRCTPFRPTSGHRCRPRSPGRSGWAAIDVAAAHPVAAHAAERWLTTMVGDGTSTRPTLALPASVNIDPGWSHGRGWVRRRSDSWFVCRGRGSCAVRRSDPGQPRDVPVRTRPGAGSISHPVASTIRSSSEQHRHRRQSKIHSVWTTSSPDDPSTERRTGPGSTSSNVNRPRSSVCVSATESPDRELDGHLGRRDQLADDAALTVLDHHHLDLDAWRLERHLARRGFAATPVSSLAESNTSSASSASIVRHVNAALAPARTCSGTGSARSDGVAERRDPLVVGSFVHDSFFAVHDCFFSWLPASPGISRRRRSRQRARVGPMLPIGRPRISAIVS